MVLALRHATPVFADAAATAVVLACAMALIAAGRFLPF